MNRVKRHLISFAKTSTDTIFQRLSIKSNLIQNQTVAWLLTQ